MIEYFEQIISICSGLGSVAESFSKIAGVFSNPRPERIENYLQKIAEEGLKLKIEPERLSDNILYAPNLSCVEDTTKNSQEYVNDLREIREFIDPVQRALNSNILSSAMILTPEKMKQAMKKGEWGTLAHISPITQIPKQGIDPHMVPILFQHDGAQFIGWQMPNLLENIDCKYNKLWLPHQDEDSDTTHNETFFPNGTPEYPSARYYKGTVFNGKPHGYGIMKFDDGGEISGDWENGFYKL
ncbi:MAG: MORN repeat-containing protein [Candidatus Parabeggiatoa sp.]|nr:MORN repeat-containing protein [Candidatus Parabeggiatoa sp.]